MNKLKTELKYASLSAIALIIWVTAEHLLGFNTTKMEIGQYTQPIIAIVVVVILFFGIREKKNKELNGQLKFFEGLKTAFYISLFYALLHGVWFALYSQIINPNYGELSLQFQEKQLVAEGKTPQQITEELGMTKMIFGNIVIQFAFFMISTTIINTIVGAIVTIFLRTKNDK
jgi:membrane protease YdiL (CAAX protease family)